MGAEGGACQVRAVEVAECPVVLPGGVFWVGGAHHAGRALLADIQAAVKRVDSSEEETVQGELVPRGIAPAGGLFGGGGGHEQEHEHFRP